LNKPTYATYGEFKKEIQKETERILHNQKRGHLKIRKVLYGTCNSR
jgi:hypothetical protein